MASKQILIIDDDADLGEEMADILRDEGHAVYLFSRYEEKQVNLKEKVYDVIILDFKMPGMSGIDILRVVREHSPRTKVFLISGKPFVEKLLAEASLLDSVAEVIKKPFPIQALLERIRAV